MMAQLKEATLEAIDEEEELDSEDRRFVMAFPKLVKDAAARAKALHLELTESLAESEALRKRSEAGLKISRALLDSIKPK